MVAIVCAVSLAPAIGAAHPAAVKQARQQVTAADIDYRLGRFAAALEKYTRAYELYPVPELLFNIAQCHKNLKDFAKAIFFYEGYLRDAPNAANRALVQDLIRESSAELAKATPREALPSAPADEAPLQPIEAAPQPAPPPAPPPAGLVVPPAPPPRRFLVASVALLGGGVAAAVGGGVFYDYGQKRGPHEMFVYDDTRWLGGAMIAIGGAAIATSVVLWLRGAPDASGPVATVAPGGGSLGWRGAF